MEFKTLTEAIDNRNENSRHKIKMSESRFWEIVDSFEWAKNCTNRAYQDVIEAEGRKRISFQEADDLFEAKGLAFSMLYDFIGDRNPAGGSDDSHGDFIHHIIGLGKKEFYASLKDYERIEKRGEVGHGKAKGYVESFSYVLPYPSDYPEWKNGKDEIEYDVVIEAIVRKKIRVSVPKGSTEEDATEQAHELFSTVNDGVEFYSEDCKSVTKVHKSS